MSGVIEIGLIKVKISSGEAGVYASHAGITQHFPKNMKICIILLVFLQ
jgi:hypothetical protein